jgi:hypothetical protein
VQSCPHLRWKLKYQRISFPYLTDYVHQEFPRKLAGAGDLERESGAWKDWEGWRIVHSAGSGSGGIVDGGNEEFGKSRIGF